MKKATRKMMALLLILGLLAGIVGGLAVSAAANGNQIDFVESLTVSGEGNTLNTGISYPVGSEMNVTFSFIPESSVTRVLLIAKNFAMGTDLHDKSRGFVWIDISGDTWSYRCDEGMTATVIKGDNGAYHVTASYTTPDVAVTSMYYHIYSDNGATAFSNILTTYEVAACAHKNTKVEGAVDATCTEAGYTGKTVCTDCGSIIDEGTVINALGHTPGDEATCTTAQVCTVCQTELAAPKGHTPGEDATCTTAQICSVCQAELTAALGHVYENRVCSVCGEADPKANRTTIDFVESITVTGENNTLNTEIRYPVNETMYLDFSFVPESGVTRVLLVAKAYAPGTALHDKSFGFVWIDINGDEWSFRSDEGMIFDATNVTKEDGVYYVTAAYTTPDVAVDSMYYHLYSDGGATVCSDIKTTYDAPEGDNPEPTEPPVHRTTIDFVESITVTGENNTLNTGIRYPVNETMYLDFSFVPESGVTRVLLVAKAYAPGTALHDKSYGFVWIDITGDTWSARCDEGMTATVTKEDGVYYVTAFYTTPNAAVDSVYYHLYSNNGTTVFSNIVTAYNAPEGGDLSNPENPKTGDAISVFVAMIAVSAVSVAVCILGRKKRSV